MADQSRHHIIDIARHGGTEPLSEPIPKPEIGETFELDDNVIQGM